MFKRECIIFDIDGTIADISHRRHYVATKPKNWAAFNAGISQDKPNDPVCRVLGRLGFENEIIFCSGRGEELREGTIKWYNHMIYGQYKNAPFMQTEHLYMRPAKDNRPDYIIKLELLEKIRLAGWEPWLAFDDRDQVVNAWRGAGIPCFQVAPGNF